MQWWKKQTPSGALRERASRGSGEGDFVFSLYVQGMTEKIAKLRLPTSQSRAKNSLWWGE